MVKYKLLSENFVDGADEKQSIRRVVDMKDVKSLSHGHIKAHKKTGKREIAILECVTHHGLHLAQYFSKRSPSCARHFLK